MLAYKSLILVSLLRVVAGSNVLSLNPVGCVDPNSFSSCVNTVENIGAQCIQQCQIGDVNCNGACGGAAVDGEIQCYIQYCWNKVRPKLQEIKKRRENCENKQEKKSAQITHSGES